VMEFDVAVAPFRLPSGVRRKANGEQAGIRDLPPLWMPADPSATLNRGSSNERTLSRKNQNAYALGTNAVTKSAPRLVPIALRGNNDDI